MEEEEIKDEYIIYTHLLSDFERDQFIHLLERLEQIGCTII